MPLDRPSPSQYSLEIGLRHSLLIRRENLELGLDLKLLYISDIHLRPSNQDHLFSELLNAFKDSSPDIVLLGGDLVDHPGCLGTLTELTSCFSRRTMVGAVYGNHDVLVGRGKVKNAVLEGNARWLPEQPISWRGVQLLG